MKTLSAIAGIVLLFLNCNLINAQEVPPLPPEKTFAVDSVKLEGEIIDDDNISFNLSFTASADEPGTLKFITGKITELSSELKIKGSGFLWLGKGDFNLGFRDGSYVLDCLKAGKCDVKFSFAAKVEDLGIGILKNKNAQQPQIFPPEERKKIKSCSFGLLPAIARSIQITSKKKDVELEIPGALNVEKKDVPGTDGAVFSAVLPPEGDLTVTWRSQIEKISANLVTSVQAVAIADVYPGTVKLNSLFNYTVIQGKLSNLELKISADLNVLSVNGENIQDWKVLDEKEAGKTLIVILSRQYEDSYSVAVEAEKVLPDFPSKFSLPSAIPQKTLRIDGYLAFGTNGAIKLIVDKTSGLSQIDNSAFPPASELRRKTKDLPKRSLFTYKFSGEKYSLETSADNIMPSYTVDLNYVLTFKDEDLLVRAICSLDIKDAPLRELLVRYSSDMTVNRVEGRAAKADDYELFEKDGQKWLKIPFAPDTIGKTDLFINFEKSMKKTTSTKIPSFFIDKAKSVGGQIILSANRGLSLSVEDLKKLRKIPTGSALVREPGLQLAFRFKEQDWEGKINVMHEQVNIVSEVFHIGSVGEGTIYGSSIFTYHVSGAPVDRIQLKVNPLLKNLEFTGGNIIDWKMTEDKPEFQTWQVNFREKIFGDYTLLATYETPLSGSDTNYKMGDLNTSDAGAESGFIALTSVRNLKVSALKSADSITEIEASEIPGEYKGFLQNPILKAYRFSSTPHWIDLNISGYSSQQMINIAGDYAKYSTSIDRNGQAVTTAEYRIKNSSLQFLSMELPEKSELWTVKVNDDKKRVSSSGTGKYLIPLPRNQNTDDPIKVEISYAQKNAELGKSADLKLFAPVLNLETMFSRWVVQVPDNYNITEYAGNMSPLHNPQRIGLSGILTRFSAWMHRFMNPMLFIPWIAITALGACLAWSWSSGKLRILTTSVCVILIGIVLLFACAVLERQHHKVNLEFMPEPVNTCEFTRLFSLPQDTPKIEVYMTDMKAFSIFKLGFAVFTGLIALGFLSIGGLSSGKIKSPLLLSLGLVFLTYSLSQWLYLNAITAFLLATLVPVILSFSLWRVIFKKCRTVAAAFVAFCVLIPFTYGAADSGVTIEEVHFNISATITDNDKAVTGTARYMVKADGGGVITLLPAPAVLTGAIPQVPGIEITRGGKSYMLKAKSSGEYEFDLSFLLPITEEKGGSYNFPLNIPVCKRNSVSVKMNRENIDIKSDDAVFFKSSFTNNLCSAESNFVPGSKAVFLLRPLVRKVEKEKTLFFTSIDALAKFASGFVETKYLLNFQVAQGETAKFAVEVPKNMRVTSVNAPDLGAWRFNEESHLLEIFLSQPHHGNFTVAVVTQIANCNLPYEAKIGTLSVRDSDKQYGTVGISAESNVQVLVDDKLDGFNSINLNDFTAKFADAGANLKKAFRYNKPPASLTVKATAVEPELRVKENCKVSFEEEKTILVSDMEVEIAKAGIFSVSIDIPENFDIDKVTGKNVQHWDEISEKNIHRLLVHFDKSVIGSTDIHIELTMLERKREKSMTIPKISVVGAQKHKGDLVITVERGTRMDIVSRQGLEIKTEGFAQGGDKSAHRFSIVRSDWELKVGFDVISPWVQAEILQIGKVTDGVVEYDVHFHYAIENAGVKFFRIRLPENAETPEFTGENIAGTQNLGKNLWEIELHQKVSGKYRLQTHYRQPYEKNAQVKISSVLTEGTELQKGYLAVLSEDSLQVKLAGKTGEISEFDARKIPSNFKVNYLSNAVMCFRTVGNDFTLTLDVVRHKAAEQLKAQIKSVNISSVVSPEGRVITTTLISLNNGNENFLEMKLPEGSSMWSVLIDSQAVDVAKEKGNILIPLRQGLSGGGRNQNIEIIYSLQADKSWSPRWQIYNGPSFNIPLNNISWNLYLPADSKYSGFRGSLDYFDRMMTSITYVNLEDYDRGYKMFSDENRKNAKVLLTAANKYAASGKKQEAMEYFQNASNLSANDAELNADVKGQWIQMQRDNSIQGLFNRRAVQKKGKSGAMEEEQQRAVPQAAQVEDINVIKQQLGGMEISHLQTISDKIFVQQQAAAAVPHPLRLTIPQGGTKIEFRRMHQVTPFAPAHIEFKAKKIMEWRNLSGFFAGIILVIGLTVLLIMIRPAFRKS